MEDGLLRAFRRGDPDALEAVYLDHVREVEAWIRGALLRSGRLTPADLGDLVQDTFLRAFSESARASYDGLRPYPPFLMTLAKNLFVDWARRTGRELPRSDILEGPLAGEGTVGTASAGAKPGDAVTDSGDGEPFEPAVVALADAYVQSLPDELKRIHHQRFVLGTPQRQAAEALGISRQTLRTLEKRLIVGLRRRLREAGVEPLPAPAKKSNPGDRDARNDLGG
jgi:RNA polymerase sigma-70 factor (ECF subfamily)